MKQTSLFHRVLIALVALVIGFTPAFGASAQPSLINMSNRVILHAKEITIFGFVLSQPQRLLVRAVGPEMVKFGVTDTNPDPVLTIYSGQTVVASIDDWEDQPIINGKQLTTASVVAAAASATGAFPLDSGSNSAATVITLQPGAYTVQVQGSAGVAGEVLIELYTVPDSVPAS